MGEQVEDQAGDVDVTNPQILFDNLTILKEFGNIVNLVRNEDFLETFPKAKFKRMKWVPMFNCLKQDILDDMVQELSSMWQYENMMQKLEILERQKEKFEELNKDEALWRPQLGDVQAQLKANEVADLQKRKVQLEALAMGYESRVSKLKKAVSAKRGYLKALQMDILKYQKKNDDFIPQVNEKLENHERLVDTIIPNKIDFDEINFECDT